MELRPLDLSGMFQRALAIYAQNFAFFVALAAVVVAPVALVQFAVTQRIAPQLDSTLVLLQHPERFATAPLPAFVPAALGAIAASALFGYVMLGFAVSAVAAAAGCIYRNEPAAVSRSYAVVLTHSFSILAVVMTAALALVAAYAVALGLVAIPFAAASLSRSAVALMAPIALTGVLITVTFALLVLEVTTAGALCAVVIERSSALAAMRLSLLRFVNRREFGRALLCALSVGAIGLFASTLTDAGAMLGLTRWPVAYAASAAIERVVVVPFLALVLAVYYFDVRIRHEGYGLDGSQLVPDPDEPVYAATAYLAGPERAAIKRFLERRDSLAPKRRSEIAARLAAPARERVPPELARLDDESLLERL
ncbi:MAG TPA: hypothetical protein VEW74_02740 [Candidatus Nitrosotalea sp.]|nr:hypothetical protein [Candidatus Nitrosotalea sp.]